MGVIAQLFVDLARVALGMTPFSLIAWTYVTVLLLIVGPVLVQVAPKLVDPPARLLASEPLRVVLWMPISTIGLVLVTALLIITIFGAMLMPLLAMFVGMVGYLAFARLIGEQLGNRLGLLEVAPWLAAIFGITVFRLVRLVPGAGAAAHSLIVWIGFAAASCMAVRMGLAWHQRRMPDAEQFRGEVLVEWYPDGDPADGRPAPGTGRPVLDNIRGEEDR
ncbi:MAG: hypothetical protein ABI200_08125 [Gaiellales bacterium]